MLATPAPPPTGDGCSYELKFDGVRALVRVAGTPLIAHSRAQRDVSASYPELRALAFLLCGRSVTLDGELVAVNPATSTPSFSLLQGRIHVQAPQPNLLDSVPVRFIVFDVLHLDGHATTQLPYKQRRALLDQLGLDGAVVHVPPVFDDLDQALIVARGGFEGIL
ncbi:hypothetical protein ACFO1B_43895 [Dactylosporangium siamense]|nr:hypothetical protein [Dactylosporangium siamense]